MNVLSMRAGRGERIIKMLLLVLLLSTLTLANGF